MCFQKQEQKCSVLAVYSKNTSENKNDGRFYLFIYLLFVNKSQLVLRTLYVLYESKEWLCELLSSSWETMRQHLTGTMVVTNNRQSLSDPSLCSPWIVMSFPYAVCWDSIWFLCRLPDMWEKKSLDCTQDDRPAKAFRYSALRSSWLKGFAFLPMAFERADGQVSTAATSSPIDSSLNFSF